MSKGRKRNSNYIMYISLLHQR